MGDYEGECVTKEERNKKILSLAKEGVKMPAIALEVGVCEATVSRICIKYGARTGERRAVTPAMAERWYKLKYDEGVSGSAIARREDYTTETVNKWIKRYKEEVEGETAKPVSALDAAVLAIKSKSKPVKSRNWKTLRRGA